MDKPTIGIGAIIFNDKNELLLLHRIGKVGNNTWGLPGGKMEKNETFEDCITREVKEECNLDINKLNFVNIITNDIMTDIDHHYVTLYFYVNNFSGEFKNMEPSKCSELKWFSLDKLPHILFLPLSNLIKKGYFNNLIK